MALALRLTALTYVVACVDARWFQTGPDAGDWTPVTPTAEPATSNSEEWLPRITSAPDRRPLDLRLRERDDSTSTICGYSADDLDSPAATCGRDEFCRLDRRLSVVGCCNETNPRLCVVPTTCLEYTQSEQWSGDPLTTSCADSDRPHCVTHSYAADFYDLLYGATFIGCAAKPASGDIVASPVPGIFTSSFGIVTTTVTVSVSGDGASSTVAPSESIKSSSSRNVGAIAGGVVGGVAGLALIIAAVIFFLYRRKKQSRSTIPLALGRKMPPSDNDMYQNDQIPGSQYPSTFFGEAPPGMVQTSDQPVLGYPPNTYGAPNTRFSMGNNHSTEAPAYVAARATSSKPQDEDVSPIEPSPVSPVSPAENYNTMVSALSNHSPPLQPLQPAVHHQPHYQPTRSPPLQPLQPAVHHYQSYFQPNQSPPEQTLESAVYHHPSRQSQYAQYSPPPPEHYQSYQPYPGT